MPEIGFIERNNRDTHSRRIFDCMDNGDYTITNKNIINARRA